MIKKNQIYGISEDVTIAEFGEGDIIVADGYIEEEGMVCLLLSNDSPKPIGTDHPHREGKTTNEIKHDCVFIFRNENSLDVVINALQRAKERLRFYPIKKQIKESTIREVANYVGTYNSTAAKLVLECLASGKPTKPAIQQASEA